jgi:kynurenine formamidase
MMDMFWLETRFRDHVFFCIVCYCFVMQDVKIIDLTHTISTDTPTFDMDCGFYLDNVIDYGDCEEPDLFRVQKIRCNAGIGTHMDAPAHCIAGTTTIDQLDIDNLVADCIVIKVNDQPDEDYVAMPDVVNIFEKEHGQIPVGAFVLFSTGWDQYWGNSKQFINDHQFPSVHEDTARLLLERDIAGLGTDTLSADTGKSGFPVHQAILGAGKYLVENIANAVMLPPTGAKILVLPMKIKGGTEAPVRLVALIESPH